MTATVHRSIPPQRLITALNPFVRIALRSPLHRWLDGSTLILHVIGRRTGRHYDIPVGLIDLDDRLIVITQHRWRSNLRGGVDLEVTRYGRRTWMHAELQEEPGQVADTISQVFKVFGPAGVRRRLGITIEPGAHPSRDEMSAAADEFDLAVITLTAVPAAAAG